MTVQKTLTKQNLTVQMPNMAEDGQSIGAIPGALIEVLKNANNDRLPIVVMMCGISGSGKTTLSTSLQSHLPAYNFQRLSIDCIVYERHGIYSVDFPAELGEKYQEEADEIFHASTVQQLEQIPPSNLILDRAFYAKKDRDEYRRLVEDRGAKTILVYLQADRDTLWRRIQERKARIGGRVAGAAFEVTEDILSSYLDGFQCPRGEGEFVINIS